MTWVCANHRIRKHRRLQGTYQFWRHPTSEPSAVQRHKWSNRARVDKLMYGRCRLSDLNCNAQFALCAAILVTCASSPVAIVLAAKCPVWPNFDPHRSRHICALLVTRTASRSEVQKNLRHAEYAKRVNLISPKYSLWTFCFCYWCFPLGADRRQSWDNSTTCTWHNKPCLVGSYPDCEGSNYER